jgi:hypothetical protein
MLDVVKVAVLCLMKLPTNLEREFVVDVLPLSGLEGLRDLLARAGGSAF